MRATASGATPRSRAGASVPAAVTSSSEAGTRQRVIHARLTPGIVQGAPRERKGGRLAGSAAPPPPDSPARGPGTVCAPGATRDAASRTVVACARPDAAVTIAEYTCPMHPEVVRPEPGACPLCGMALEPG